MRTAVLRVRIDPLSTLLPADFDRGVTALRAQGYDVVATPSERLAVAEREVELVIDAFVPDDAGRHVGACAAAFGCPAASGVVTYVSRGTDDDVHGVLEALGASGTVTRSVDGTDELVTVTLDALTLERVSESRLHTALEAALNCEVRLVSV